MEIDLDMGHGPIDWYIALGSNLGDSLVTLRRARAEIARLGTLAGASALYRSEPMYETDQPAFLNGLVWLRSETAGEELLEQLREIELKFGRVRDDARRYGPRSLDLDIIAGQRGAEEVVYATPSLTVPHERMAERGFVLRPLVDVAPDWNHPCLGLSAKELLERLGEDASLQVAYQSEEWA